MNNSAEILPDWDDLGKKFSDGLILFAVGLVYALPLIIIFLPVGIIAGSSLLSGNRNLQDISNILSGAGMLLLYCILCLVVVYGVTLSVVYPAILVVFSHGGTFASCFKFQQVFELVGKNAGPFFTAWIVSFFSSLGIALVIGFLSAFVGWIPCIGWIFSIVVSLGSSIYIMTVYSYLFGQFGAVAFAGNQPVG